MSYQLMDFSLSEFFNGVSKGIKDFFSKTDSRIMFLIAGLALLVIFLLIIIIALSKDKKKKLRPSEESAPDAAKDTREFETISEATSESEPLTYPEITYAGLQAEASAPTEVVQAVPPPPMVVDPIPEPLPASKPESPLYTFVKTEDPYIHLDYSEKEELELLCNRKIKACAISGTSAQLQHILYLASLLKNNRLRQKDLDELKLTVVK